MLQNDLPTATLPCDFSQELGGIVTVSVGLIGMEVLMACDFHSQ